MNNLPKRLVRELQAIEDDILSTKSAKRKSKTR
jgi:hypothetical protein